MSVVGDLRRARDIVAKGWCPRGLYDELGNVCAVGAVNIACEGHLHVRSKPTSRRDEALRALIRHLPGSWQEVYRYNDDPSTTHQDILNLFDKALADLGGLGDQISA